MILVLIVKYKTEAMSHGYILIDFTLLMNSFKVFNSYWSQSYKEYYLQSYLNSFYVCIFIRIYSCYFLLRFLKYFNVKCTRLSVFQTKLVCGLVHTYFKHLKRNFASIFIYQKKNKIKWNGGMHSYSILYVFFSEPFLFVSKDS